VIFDATKYRISQQNQPNGYGLKTSIFEIPAKIGLY